MTLLFNGKDPTFVRAIRTHQAHCRRHGHPLILLRHAILDGVWSKPAYILAVLLEELRKPERERLAWLLYGSKCWKKIFLLLTQINSWVDADTVVMNPKIPLDIFLPPIEFPHTHLLLSADPHGVNNGVFFIKVNPWSVELLSAVIAYTTFRPETQLRFRDQSALEELLKERAFKKNFSLVPQRWFNAYQSEIDDRRTLSFQVEHGDFLVHFPGVPNRQEQMKRYLDKSEHHLPEWELDLASTNYTAEIKSYWDEQIDLLQKERARADQVVDEANDLMKDLGEQTKTHWNDMTSGDRETILAAIDDFRKTLDENTEDEEILEIALKDLQKVCIPYLPQGLSA